MSPGVRGDGQRREFHGAHGILVDHGAGRPVPGPDALEALVEELRGPGSQRLARRLLALALAQRPTSITLRQKLALSTYKDPELPIGHRLDLALGILEDGADLDATDDQETLSLAGAIHKDCWELDGQTRHLLRALDSYGHAHAAHVGDGDYDGYPGINAAFVLDLLADALSQDHPRGGPARRAVDDCRNEADRIRREIADRLGPRLAQRPGGDGRERYWQLATMAEALLGEGGEARHREARAWLERAAHVEPHDWMRESTARQLARLAQLRGADLLAPTDSAADALRPLLPNDPACLASLHIGKVGLALSGGGFRASLFHIGVLARLAELDVLRHVEVLSCVSGGSIVGAAYYLRLRERLEAHEDGTLQRGDYIALVDELATGFGEGVRKNLRMRLVASPVAWAKIGAIRGYNRTARAGELYEQLFYQPVLERTRSRRGLRSLRRAPRPRMRDLRVRPRGEREDFTPQDHNWQRLDKIPILVINATTLNTGHGWQFTASWMGEPPSALEGDVDRNPRLRRMYYDQAPGRHRDLPLGTAVAASAAVPGLFAPITLAGLYPDTTVRLTDGGVHDNQGVSALVEQECGVMIVSDASGQMHEQAHPRGLAYSVLKRASSALSGRVRRAQWEELSSRRRGGILRGLMFLHLRLDLGGGARDWIGCQDPQEDEAADAPGDTHTYYGVRRDVQARLARLRTDLDGFSDVEANGLMTSGYRMAAAEFPRRLGSIPVSNEPPHDWGFLEGFDSLTATPRQAARTVRALERGHRRWRIRLGR